MDIITQPVEQWPPHSGLVWVDQIDLKLGGVALNPAVTVAKLGGIPAGLIGYIGADAAGQMIRSEVERLELDTSRLVTDPGRPTGVCIVGVHPDTERSFLISSGANSRLRGEPIAVTGLAAGDYFHIGGGMSLAGLPKLFAQVKAQSAYISIDVALAGSDAWWSRLKPLFPLTDIFMANASEAAQLTGSADADRAGQFLAAAGPKLVVIKLGREGCYLLSPTWTGLVAPFAVTAVDTTGAGDAFAGAFLYGLARGWEVDQAATLANAVGALCAATAGATEGLRPYAETVAFIQAQGRAGDWNWD